MADVRSEELLELTTSIVGAYVSNNSLPQSELAGLIREVSSRLASLDGSTPPTPQPLKPPVPIKKSVTDEYLISLEDGKKYKSLKRHLTTRGLTPDEYRQKWNLPSSYPMVAAGYSARRSALAKKLGLGRKPAAAKSAAKRIRKKAVT